MTRFLSFLVFLVSIQTANLPAIMEYITANSQLMPVHPDLPGGGPQPELQLYAGYHLRATDQERGALPVENDEHLLARNTLLEIFIMNF